MEAVETAAERSSSRQSAKKSTPKRRRTDPSAPQQPSPRQVSPEAPVAPEASVAPLSPGLRALTSPPLGSLPTETPQELTKRILAMEVRTAPLGEAAELFVGLRERVTAREAILLAQAVKAMTKGDTSSAAFLRDMAGEKPGEQAEGPFQNPFSALTPEELRAFVRSRL